MRHALCLGLVTVLALVAAAADDDVCTRRWTVGGSEGQSEPWLRVGGYRIGMTKSEAHQIRRAGLQNSIAQDTWNFLLSGARAVLVFEDGKLASATFVLEGHDYQKVYADYAELLGLPIDASEKYAIWRSDDCNTVKMLTDDGTNPNVVVQSIDYFERVTLGRGKKKEKKG